jgi:hypothetical protein
LIAFLAGFAATASLAPIQAAKPVGGGGGSVPAGKVFYTWSSELSPSGFEWQGWWNMNADGSGKQLLPYQPSSYSSAHLSHLVHQGHRWFLEFRLRSPLDITGAVYAVRDDGDPAYSVILAEPEGVSLGHFHWSKDDSFVSITALPETTNALDRLYIAAIVFDPDTGLPALTTPLTVVAEGEQPGQADIHHHDWSPYGDEIVYQVTGNPGDTFAMIVDLMTGTIRLFAANAWTPVWSPDGTRIAYWGNGGVWVSKPDGTALLKITNNNSSHYDVTAGWSPDSQHVLISRNITKSIKGGGQGYLSDVLRVPATGGTAVNLTRDIDGYSRAMYWR